MIVNLSEKFIDNLYNIRNIDIPDSVVYQSKRCLIDYLGATFAGAQILKQKGNKLLNYLGQTNGDIAVIGFNRKAGVENAAFMNGLSSHIAELDDGVISGIVHPGSPVFSALLPVAEKEKVNGKDLILGIITGYEATVRLANAIQPSHKKRGYHATGTCGTIGAALGIGAMMGFSKSQMKDTLSSAAVSALGTLKVLEDESELKPFNVAQAALDGLLATSMAWAGFGGPDDVLAGNRGFFSMMADECDLSYLETKNNTSFAVEKVYVKPYAACRYCHPAIEAALKIKSTYSIQPENIESIKVSTYFWAVANHDHTKINGISSAKMSIPYSVAVALVFGNAGIKEYSLETVNNSKVYSLTQKISVSSAEQLTALFPQKSIAVVVLTTYDGDSYTERVDLPKGEPENPLSDQELEEKFISLSTFGGKTKQECQEILQIVWNLETDFLKLYELL